MIQVLNKLREDVFSFVTQLSIGMESIDKILTLNKQTILQKP